MTERSPVANWLKVQKETPDKPEIAILARKLGVSIGDAFLEWFKLYAWADGITVNGVVPNMSLSDADKLARVMPRTAEHLASREVGWLRVDSQGINFEKWDRHNGKSAKSRALDAEKKRKARSESTKCPTSNGTISGLDERRREESLTYKDVGDVGSSCAPTSRPSRPSKELRDEIRQRHTAELADLDWSEVIAVAEAAARRVPPLDDRDRRAWLKFGVLALTAFSEAWLADAGDSAARSTSRTKTKQAYFVGALKHKALEQWGVDDALFKSMVRSIEIPTDVWKSQGLEVQK